MKKLLSERGSKKTAHLSWWIWPFLIVFLSLILLRMLNFEMRRDEQLYATVAGLMGEMRLYEDVFYNHVPVSAWYFYFLKILAGTDNILLISRLGVFLGWVVLALSVVFVCYRLTRSSLIAAVAVSTLIFNELLLGPAGMIASNNFLTLPLVFLGYACFIIAIDRKPASRGLGFLAGLLVALAAATKVSAVAFILPLAIVALAAPRRDSLWTRLWRVTLPVAVGGMIGALPVLVPLIRTPEMFLVHVLDYHLGPQRAYWAAQNELGANVAYAIEAKIRLAVTIWVTGTNALLLFFVLALIAMLKPQISWSRYWARFFRAPMLLVLAGTAMAVGMAIIPTPAFPQYFAPPLTLVPLLIALLAARLPAEAINLLRPLFLALIASMALFNLPRLAQSLPVLRQIDSLETLRVHRDGERIAAALENANLGGPVASLMPVFLVEGGVAMYPEFATGQFAYRIGDIADPALVAAYVTTSPSRAYALFENTPPAGFLIGFDEVLERPFRKFIADFNYEKVPGLSIQSRYGTGELFLRPAPPG